MTDPRRAFAGTYGPALLGAAVSLVLARFFSFAPFFLVPIGIVALKCRALPVAVSVGATVLLNWAAGLVFAGEGVRLSASGVAADSLYFAALVGTFAWAAYGADGIRQRRPVRTAYRLSAAAIVASVALIPIMYLAKNDEGLVAFVRDQAVAVSELYKSAAGADVVQQSLLERGMTPEAVTAMFAAVISHGAVFGHAVFFAVSWRFALSLAAFRNPYLRNSLPLTAFRNDFALIWVLIGSLLASFASLLIDFAPLSIVGWNLLFLCALLYGAQGMAIIAYNIARPSVPRFFRFMAFFLIAVSLFRPGINAFVVAAIAAVGVAENWLPLRAPQSTEPPPTPGA